MISKTKNSPSRSGKSQSRLDYGILEPKHLMTADLIANGGFEDIQNFDSSGLYPSRDVSAWQTNDDTQTSVLAIRERNDSSNLSVRLDSRPDTADSLYQYVETSPEQEYLLTFEFYSKQRNGRPDTGDFEVLWNGDSVGIFRGAQRWQSGGLVLTGTNDVSKLEFRELGQNDGLGALLNDVSLVPIESSEAIESRWSAFDRANPTPSTAASDDNLNQQQNARDLASHSFNLDPNKTYNVSFQVQGEIDHANADLRVSWNGERVASIAPNSIGNQHSIQVQANSQGQGLLVLSDSRTNASPILIDTIRIDELGGGSASLLGSAQIFEFDIDDVDRQVFAGQQVNLTWNAVGAERYGIELWNAQATQPIDTTNFIRPGGTGYGNIHSNINQIPSGQSQFAWEIPDIVPGEYKLKLVAWNSNGTAEKEYLDIEIGSRPDFSVRIFDKTISPGQRIRVGFQIDRAIVPVGTETTHRIVITSGNGALDEFYSRRLNFIQTTDIRLETFEGARDFLIGEVEVDVSLSANENSTFDIVLDNSLVTVDTITNVEVTAIQPASFQLDPTSNLSSAQLADNLDRTNNLLSSTIGNFQNDRLRNFFVSSLSRQQLFSEFNVDHENFVQSLDNAFGGRAKLHNDWNPQLPTVILTHGILTGAGDQLELGNQIGQFIENANVVSYHWGRVPLLAGEIRDIDTALNLLDNDIDQGGNVIDTDGRGFLLGRGAVELSSLMEFITTNYEENSQIASGRISTISHSLGTVVTSMALALSNTQTHQQVWSNAIFLGANLDADSTVAGDELDSIFTLLGTPLRISNLFSRNDNVVTFNATLLGQVGAGHLGFAVDHPNVFDFDAELTNISAIGNANGFFEDPEIVHCRSCGGSDPTTWTPEVERNGGSVGWFDWLVQAENSRGFLSRGLEYSYFSNYLDDLKYGEIPIFPNGTNHTDVGQTQVSPSLASVDLANIVALGPVNDSITVDRGETVIAVANNPTDPDGFIARANFYRDVNNDGFAQEDELIGSDFDPGNGWRQAFSTHDFPLGEVSILGVVFDNEGNQSTAKENNFLILDPDAPPPELETQLPIQDVNYNIATHQDGDIVYSGYQLNSGQIDYWGIATNREGATGYTIQTRGDTDTVVGLYDFVTGELLAFDEDNGDGENGELQNIQLEPNRAYVIAVAAQDSSEGQYDLDVTGITQLVDSPFSLQAPLYQQTVTNSVDDIFEVDYYEVFSPAIADSLTIRLTSDTNLDGWFRLEDSQHNTIASAFLAGDGEIDSIWDQPISPNETYYVAVSSVGSSEGNYSLELNFGPDESGLPDQLEPTPDAITAIPFHFGSIQLDGIIEAADEFVYYALPARTSNQFLSHTFNTLGDLDTQIGLYRRLGDSLSLLEVSDDDSGAGQNALIDFDIDSDDDYIIAVRSDNGETGPFSLQITGPPLDTVQLTASGLEFLASSQLQTLNNSRRFVTYEVDAPDGSTSLDVTAAAFNDLDVSVRIHDAGGNILGTTNNFGAGQDEQIIDISVLAGETYYVTAFTENYSIGNYQVDIDFDPDVSINAGGEFPVNSNTFNDQNFPDVARHTDGTYVVAWSSTVTLGSEIVFRRFNANDQPIGPETVANQIGTEDRSAPKVAYFDDGRFAISWIEEPFSTRLLKARVFNADGTAAGPEFSTGIIGSPFNHEIAVSNTTNRILVTTSVFGGLDSRIFDDAGNPVTGIFEVNRTADTINGVSATSDENGDFIITWSSVSQNDRILDNGPTVSIIAKRIDPDGNEIDNNRGDFVQGQIAGVWFDDLNQNGVQDSNEPGLSNIELFLDQDNDGTPDPSEPVLVTQSDGSFEFNRISPGIYQVLPVNASSNGPSSIGDDFDRPDSTEPGINWTELATDFRIEDGQLRSGFESDSVVVFDAFASQSQTIVTELSGAIEDGERSVNASIFLAFADEENHIEIQFNDSNSAGDSNFDRIFFKRGSDRFLNESWAGAVGGDPSVAITPFETANVFATYDPVSQSISVGIDRNQDGVYEDIFHRGGIRPEGLGQQVALGGRQDVAFDNFIVDPTIRSVIEPSAAPDESFLVAQDQVAQQTDPAIAADPSGGFTIAYRANDVDGTGANIYAQKFLGDSLPDGERILVNSELVGTQDRPSIAIANQGQFIVSWESNDSSGDGVFARRFNVSNQPIGPDFQVNEFTTSDQQRVSSAGFGDTITLVWQSQGQDSSGFGVFGRNVILEDVAEPELEVQDSSGDQNDRFIDFGELAEDTAPVTQSFTILNDGNATLEIFNLSLTGNDFGLFQLTGPTNFNLQPGESQSLTVQFDPTIEGSFFSSIRFEHNDDSDTLGGDFDSTPQFISLRADVLGSPRLQVELIPELIREGRWQRGRQPRFDPT